MQSFITFLCTTKNGRTERLTIKNAEFTIGRSKECALYMPFPEVSRVHCDIRIAPDHSVIFTDVRASSVGILHNGKYKKEGVLNPGDEFFIGDTRFVLVEFAGNVVVADNRGGAHTDQVRIDDGLSEGLSKAESAIQTALGISLVSGKTAQETGDVMSWSDITAISIAAKNKAPLPTGPVKSARESDNQNLMVGMMVACLIVAVVACVVAFWAVSKTNHTESPHTAPVPTRAVAPVSNSVLASKITVTPQVVPLTTSSEPLTTASQRPLRIQLKNAEAKREVLLLNKKDYETQAQAEDNKMAAKVNALDAKIATETVKQAPAKSGAFSSSITKDQIEALQSERDAAASTLISRREIIEQDIRDKFTEPLRLLEIEINGLKEKLGN